MNHKLIQTLDRWLKSPLAFVLEFFEWEEKEGPTEQQKEFLNIIGEIKNVKENNIKNHIYTDKIGISVAAGRGVGKDAIVSWLIIWFAVCFNDYKGLVTAPTSGQLQDVLWTEIDKWLSRSKFKNILIKQKTKIFKEGFSKWFISARTINTASITSQGETLSGRHEDYMLFVIDEASGVPEAVFTPLEGSLTGKMNLIILISNPTQMTGYFYDSHHKYRKNWICLEWNAEVCPLVSDESIKILINKYGRNSNYYRINVLGQFAVEEVDTLIPYDWISRSIDKDVNTDNELERWGVDVATSEGIDTSVLIKQRGWKILNIIKYPKIDTMALTGWISVEDRENEADIINIDAIGVGDGVCHRLIELYRAKRRYGVVNKVKVSEKPLLKKDQDKFYRLKDQLFWNVREAFEKGLVSIPRNHPHSDELIGQLSSIKIKDMESAGKIRIESKREMKARGLSSPDLAEAFALSGYSYHIDAEMQKHKNDPYAFSDDDDLLYGNKDLHENAWMGL